MRVPFFRPSLTEEEITAVTDCLRSGWLTTGPITRDFEQKFAEYVGARYAVAVNSCTAALHLALEAIGLQRGELVLVPTMTFAATAEVVRYFDAIPVFVDCDEATMCISPVALRKTLESITASKAVSGLAPPFSRVRAVIPMHYGGQMVDVAAIRAIADEFGIAVIDDAAHTLPARFRENESAAWRSVGTTADITCFSFYANKCITTGEGGMAVTDNEEFADRMRLMSLHGLSKDAWKRYTSARSWYYEVVAPGFKYNLTDIASALGRAQLTRANALWQQRRALAERYAAALVRVPGVGLPVEISNREHSWHLFSIRLDLDVWRQGRNAVIEQLKEAGVATSVHWQPLHLQPYYREAYGLAPGMFPVAESLWPRLISLPMFPGMTDEEVDVVVNALLALVDR